VPVSFAAAFGSPGGGLIRATSLAATRVEIEVDPDAGLTRVTLDRADGSRALPPRYEASARLSLRRAIAALRRPDVEEVRDLDDLITDAAVASQVVGDVHNSR
jgi:hypothetical protein